MILIADASALIALACCNSLDLLEALFQPGMLIGGGKKKDGGSFV